MVDFTDEEGYGRYLDLHDCYLKYINLKGAEVTTLCFCLNSPLLFKNGPRFLTVSCILPETGLHHLPFFIWPTLWHPQGQEERRIQKVGPRSVCIWSSRPETLSNLGNVWLVSRRYLEMLLEYLQDYTDRVKPLLDQNELYGKVLLDFEKKWDNGTFPGWPVSPPSKPRTLVKFYCSCFSSMLLILLQKETSSALTHAGAHLDLSAFSSWEVKENIPV